MRIGKLKDHLNPRKLHTVMRGLTPRIAGLFRLRQPYFIFPANQPMGLVSV